MALEQSGFEVVTTAEYQDIVQLITSTGPALAILDFKLNGQECILAYQQISHLRPDLPVIVMSCNPEINITYREHGFRDYIIKPFDLDEFERVCRKYL